MRQEKATGHAGVPTVRTVLPSSRNSLFEAEAESKSFEKDSPPLCTYDVEDVGKLMQGSLDKMSFSQVLGLTCVLGLGNAADAVEITKAGFFLPDLPDLTVTQASLLTCSVFLGMFFGGALVGSVSDQVGRRMTYTVTLAINGIASLGSAIFPSLGAVIFFRFIGGITIGGTIPCIFTYGAELFPTRYRGKVITAIGSFFMVGSIYVAVAAMIMLANNETSGTTLSSSMRSYVVVTSFPVWMAFILAYLYIPESPLFLLNKKKYAELLIVLQSAYGATSLELAPLKMMLDNSPPQVNTKVMKPTSYWSETKENFQVLISSPSLFKQAICLMVVYTTLAYSSYGITIWISKLYLDEGIKSEYQAALLFTAAHVPANIISICMVDWAGRKKLLVIGLGCSFVAGLISAFATSNKALIIALTSLFNMTTVIAWNVLNCFSVESFPTRIRSSTMGLMGAMGRVSAAVAQFSNASMQNNVEELLIVTAVILLVGTISATLLTETSQAALSETEAPKDFTYERVATLNPVTERATYQRAQDQVL